MALVGYSDSEDSETETPITAPKPAPPPAKPAAKPAAFQKTEARKIKVDLPALKPEPGQDGADGVEQPPTKRARTAGTFGGFNALLPAPKRPGAQTGLKKGVSLKTSSEAAFSRVAPPLAEEQADDGEYDEFGNRAKAAPRSTSGGDQTKSTEPEVKMVGKATKFRPLSVANNKKKKPLKKPAPVAAEAVAEKSAQEAVPVETQDTPAQQPTPVAKPKRSLFSVQQEEVDVPAETATEYEASTSQAPADTYAQPSQQSDIPAANAPAPNSLEAVAADLNLTTAQRRHLFGRHGKDVPANIAHFNMDSEYAANEQLRQSGETIEHRAVKSIAPGKHSLQQLVNNARSNQESIEDKWAEGRRNRGDAGSKYGWGR